MGCGASTPAAVQDNDIESREAQLKARFTPTHLLRDSIDTAALLKVLELAQGSIFKRRNNVAGGDVSTAPGMSAGGAEDDDGLSSRRQQRYMTSSMLLSRRGTGLGSVAGAPPDDSSRSRTGARPSSRAGPPPVRGASAQVSARPTIQPQPSVAPASGIDTLLAEHGFTGKSLIIRIMRHPIALIHYWSFVHYLDPETASAVCSLNSLMGPAQALAATSGSQRTGTGVPGATAEDAPYEIVLMLLMHLDVLFRLGTVPPQMRNPFGKVVHVHFDYDAAAADAGLAPSAVSNSRRGSLAVGDTAAAAAAATAAAAAEERQRNDPIFRERQLKQMFMCDQYYKQYAVIKQHRTFYQTLYEAALRFQVAFCGGSQAAGSSSLFSHPQYAPNASLRALGRVLPSSAVGDLSRSLVYFINAVSATLAAVAKLEREHAANIAQIDAARASDGAKGGADDMTALMTKFRFSAVNSDTFYEIEIEGRAHRDFNPLGNFGYGAVRARVNAKADGTPASVGKGGTMLATPVDPMNFKLRATQPLDPKAYGFVALAQPPRQSYIPDLGLLVAREMALEVLAEHTLGPFLRSTLYKGLASMLLSACARRAADANARGSSAISGSRSSSSSALTTIRNALPVASIVPLSAAALLPPPPQLILLETFKVAGCSAWLGYAAGHVIFGTGSALVTGGVATDAGHNAGEPTMRDVNAATKALVMGGLGAGLSVNNQSAGPGSVSSRPLVMREAGGSGGGVNHNQTARDEAKLFPHGPRIPPSAYDMTRVTVAREALKSFCHVVPMLPHNVGVCVISMLAESPNHAAFWDYKQAMYQHQCQVAASLPRGSAPWTPSAPQPPQLEQPNTLKVVYCNAEFAAMCGGLSQFAFSGGNSAGAAAESVTNSTAASIMASIAAQANANNRRPFTANGDVLPPSTASGLRPGTAAMYAGAAAGAAAPIGGGAGYMNVLGRDYRDIFSASDDKADLLTRITSLQQVHAVTRLCSAAGGDPTPVVIAMKPVYMRASIGPKVNRRASTDVTASSAADTATAAGTGTTPGGASVAAAPRADAAAAAAAADPDCFASDARGYVTTFHTPLFYVAVAFRLHAPADAAQLTTQGTPSTNSFDFAMFNPSVAATALDFVGGASLGLIPGLGATPAGQGQGRFGRANGAGSVLSQMQLSGTYGVLEANNRGSVTGAGKGTSLRRGSITGAASAAASAARDGGASESELTPEERADRFAKRMTAGDEEALLQARWAHDSAWLNIFPDIHHVNVA